jgi:enamidase
MGTTFLTDIGVLATGRLGAAAHHETTLTVRDGRIVDIGGDGSGADEIWSARGLTVVPGFVDGHVHPSFGEWTPAQNSIGWIHNYLHGGTTTMVSAGELHIPGLDFTALSPELVTSLAITSRHTTGRMRPSGVKAVFGTVLLVPGMTRAHFDRLQDQGVTQAKYIFYDFSRLGDGEVEQYREWCRERGITVKMHSGGVSRSGASRLAGAEVTAIVQPDVVAHLSGGPIPMPDEEIHQLIDEVPGAALEICSSMNYRATQVVIDALTDRGRLDRLTLGTDTPGGTGVIPRGMMRTICFLASMCGMDPLDAVAVATANTARAHGLDVGLLEVGSPADLVVLGPVSGSQASDGLGSFGRGDLPGISAVMVDGAWLVSGRSEQTPPPQAVVTRV